MKHKLFIIHLHLHVIYMSSIDWKRRPRSINLSVGKREKSAGAISGEYGGCSMIFVEFLARNSFTMIALWDGLSELVEQQRVSCPNSRLKWYELIREAQKVQRLFLLNFNIYLDPFWMHCTTHLHVFLIKSIHRKPSVTFSAIPHMKFHLQCKIWDKFFVRYSYPLEKPRNTLEINWQHRALWEKLNFRSRLNSTSV